MNIAVCDDEKVITEEISRLISEDLDRRGIRSEIRCFYDAETLLSADTRFDIIFIDCRLPGKNGLELAKKLRESSAGSDIVFFSAFPEYIFDSYEVKHLRFILKPVDALKIRKTFDTYFSGLNEKRPVMVMTDLSIPADEIIRIFRLPGKSNISVVTSSTVYNSRRTLYDIEKDLPTGAFFRVNRSEIINLAHTERHKDDRIAMDNGDVVVISRRQKTAFLRIYTQWLGENK